MKLYFAIAILLSLLGYVLFGIGGYFVYFTGVQHYAFLCLPFALGSIYLSFKLVHKAKL